MGRSRIGEDQFKDADVLSPEEHETEVDHYFYKLFDVTTYSGHPGKFLVVKDNATGLEYTAMDERMLTAIPPSSGFVTGDVSEMVIDSNDTGFGATLYMTSAGNYDEASAGSVSTAPCVALAVAAGVGIRKILLRGFIRDDNWNWSYLGQPIYMSTTSGIMTQTVVSGAGEQKQILGIATHANRIFFNPNYEVVEV